MRLTLRTLLAYLDEILEPKDAEEIGNKLQESEVASTLLHRIRDVMRRLRLKAPDVDEQDTALDPNTVAEYLDNTLPDDRVPDFEKVCLESDMHLAEVASCHQVLAMVLGEPAEIDPSSRQHMYTLQQVAAEQSEMASAAAGNYDTLEQSTKPSRPRRPRPEIPEYLRDKPKKKRWLLSAGVLVAAGCLLAVLLAATGRLEFLGIDWPFADKTVAVDSTTAEKQKQGSHEANVADDKVDAADPTATDKTDAVDAADVTAPAAEKTSAEKAPPQKAPPVSTPAAVPVQAPATSTVPPAKAPLDTSPLQTPSETPWGVIQPLAPPRQGVPEDTILKPPGAQPPVSQPPVATEPKAEVAAADAPVPPERIARFMSDNHVLLRFDAQKQEWSRVPHQDILTPQYELLSLPTFRPAIAMTAGLPTLMLVDASRIAFEPTNAAGIPGLKIDYGRVIIQTMGKEETRLALAFGNRLDGQRKGLLRFGDAASTLTIEVTHELAAGENPEAQSPRLKVNLGVVTGRVQWVEEGAEPVEIAASHQLTLGGGAFQQAGAKRAEAEKPQAMESSPDWIVADSISFSDRSASSALESELGRQRPLSLGLKELAEHRKKEVRRLAIRCLGHIGRFDQMVAVLNDPGQRLRRGDYINDLRAALSRGPGVAAHVRQAFERRYGPDAAGLYRLLWGFTDEQLQKEKADEMLVECLDHNLLAYRALGFWNLQTITALGLYYQPEQAVNKRQQAVRNWRGRLKAGDIRHRKKTPRSRPPSVKEAKPAENALPTLSHKQLSVLRPFKWVILDSEFAR